ncbi:MAG: hypothetical protein HYX84_04735 [Chloroflexi bacterium]|nr:hypothetical protein [Chloroflexota bacterium]
METVKYWWKLLVWRPIDIADRILILVGAISAFLRQGNNPAFVDLAWQVPLGSILVLLIWRIMQAPVQIIESIRRERNGEYPLTLKGVAERITKLESNLEKLSNKVEPQRTFDIQDIKQKIFWEFKAFDDSVVGGITRAIVFVFGVTNASPVWINTTGNVKGDLVVLAWRLLGVHWRIDCSGIEPGKKGTVRIIFPVSESFAKTLAFKPIDGSFYADFSEMLIELETKDNHQRYILGYLPIAQKCEIPIQDHVAYQKIRKIVEWEYQLGEDGRIAR